MSSIFRASCFLGVCLAGASIGCATDADGPDCEDGKCDKSDVKSDTVQRTLDDADVPRFACDGVVVDRSGRKNKDGSPIQHLVGRLGDRFAATVFRGADGACPTSSEELLLRLKKKNEISCPPSDPSTGGGHVHQTAVISETAELVGPQAASYRTVTLNRCAKETGGTWVSLFGSELSPGGAEIPQAGIEIAAFDEASGVFNYYKEVDGKIAFFGNSIDFVEAKAAGPGLTDVRGCANCHTSGGVIMKELTNPWLHWEGSPTGGPAGAEDLVKSRERVFGVRAGGSSMESAIRESNGAWNSTKAKHLAASGNITELLRPLFCPSQVNVATADIQFVPSTLLVDPTLRRASVFGNPDDYKAIRSAIGQSVPGTPAADTFFPFAYVLRSGEDSDYVKKLHTLRIIEGRFALDVLLVDFTRPLLSDDRCDLLAFAPDGVAASPAAIRDGFLDNLAGAETGTAAGQLKSNLEASKAGKPIQPSKVADRFFAACKARREQTVTVQVDDVPTEVNGLVMDAVKLRSLGRKIVYGETPGSGSAQRRFPVFEFGATLAADRIAVQAGADPADPLAIDPDARLGPEDCLLTNRFSPIPTAQ